MATQKMKTRIVQKHDNSDNWSQATTFKPLDGEIIIYDDRAKEDSIGINQKKLKLKVGDGITTVTNLPTIHLDWNEIDEKPVNFTPTSHAHDASEVKFADGETFQKKFDDGELKGNAGKDGAPGPAGDSGVYIGDVPPENAKVWIHKTGTGNSSTYISSINNIFPDSSGDISLTVDNIPKAVKIEVKGTTLSFTYKE